MTQVYDMARRILIQEKNNSTVVKSNERIFNGPRLLFLFFAKKATFGRFSPKIYDFFSAVGILRWGGNTSQKWSYPISDSNIQNYLCLHRSFGGLASCCCCYRRHYPDTASLMRSELNFDCLTGLLTSNNLLEPSCPKIPSYFSFGDLYMVAWQYFFDCPFFPEGNNIFLLPFIQNLKF